MPLNITRIEKIVDAAEVLVGKAFRLIAVFGLAVFIFGLVGAIVQKEYSTGLTFLVLSCAALWVATRQDRPKLGPLHLIALHAQELADSEADPVKKKALVLQAEKLRQDVKSERKVRETNESDVDKYRNSGGL